VTVARTLSAENEVPPGQWLTMGWLLRLVTGAPLVVGGPRQFYFILNQKQWCIAENGGGYMQRGVPKGLKVPCLFMIAEVSIRC